MSQPQLPILPPTFGSQVWGALLSLITLMGGGGLIAAWLRWSAARSSTPAQLQVALNGAFSALTGELQEERVQLVARIYELERELAQTKLECLQQSGEIRGLKQSRDSFQALLRRADIVIPGEDEK